MTETAAPRQEPDGIDPLASGQPEEGNPALGILLAVLAGFLFATMDAIAKMLTQSLPVEMALWGRYTFHMLVMVALFPGARFRLLVTTAKPLALIVRGGLLMGCTALFFTAITHIPLADANAIGFFAPFFVVALSVPLLGEKVGVRRWSAVGIGFLGILLIIRPGFQEVHWAYFCVLAMAFLFACFTIMTRSLAKTEAPIAMLFYSAVVGTIGGSIAASWAWQTPTPIEWLGLVTIGCIGAGSHLIIIHAYRLAPASVVAPFQYLQIVWSSTYGLLLFAHVPDVWTFAGAGVIIASGLYVWLRERQLGKARRSTSWRGGAPR